MDIDRLKDRYRGATATDYEDHRRDRKKWQREQAAVADFVEQIASDDGEPLFLDVPVGTGRFFDVYEENSVNAVGVDVSEDMLAEARKGLNGRSTEISLQRGDIMSLAELDIDPDAVVCIRFMNWLDTEDVGAALNSIADTGPDHIIVGIRVRNSTKHRIGGAARRLYHRVFSKPNSKTTVHDEQRIRNYFADYGFSIGDRRLVDEGIYGDKYIYRLVADGR